MGLGSHSPFPIHIDLLGPVSTSPGGQVKVMLVPSRNVSLSAECINTSLNVSEHLATVGKPRLHDHMCCTVVNVNLNFMIKGLP